jgi:hypothetical protein
MKRLFLILALGLLGFLSIAMLQEWRIFATAWLGASQEVVSLGEEDRKAAADTVHEYLTLLAHVHAGGGDPRFLDRLPASDAVIDELVAELDYLRRNGRRQIMVLQGLDVQAVDQLDERSVEVRTREWWTIGYDQAGNEAPAGRRTANVVSGRYLVRREPSGWAIQFAEALDGRWDEGGGSSGPEPP